MLAHLTPEAIQLTSRHGTVATTYLTMQQSHREANQAEPDQ